MKKNKKVEIICFSKDRPLQLKAYIESLYRFSEFNFSLTVIFTASRQEFHKAYEKLIKTFGSVSFLFENNLKKQLFNLIDGCSDYLMFGCDDVIFTRPLPSHSLEVLKNSEDVFAYSFRLGENTTFCQPANCSERVAPEKDIANINMVKWNWTKGVGDFGYPFELNATLYHKKSVQGYFKFLERVPALHPNLIEAYFYLEKLGCEFTDKPFMCSSKTSSAYVITVNRVQELIKNPIYEEYSTEYLLQLFDNGKVLDIDYYTGRIYNCVHIGDFKLKN